LTGDIYQSIINQKENLMPLNKKIRKKHKLKQKRRFGKKEKNRRKNERLEIEEILGKIERKSESIIGCGEDFDDDDDDDDDEFRVKSKKDGRNGELMCFSRRSSTSVAKRRKSKSRKVMKRSCLGIRELI